MGRKANTTTKQYSMPPETEVTLQGLQEKYLSPNRTQKDIDNYFLLMRQYARSLVLKQCARTRKFLTPERVDEIATDSTIRLFEQYTTIPNWKINSSFAGMLIWKVYEAMYKHKNDDWNISLESKIYNSSNDSSNKELKDVVSDTEDTDYSNNFYEEKSDNPINDLLNEENVIMTEVDDLLFDAHKNLPYTMYLKFIAWLVLKFRKAKSKNVSEFFDEMWLDNKEIRVFDILFLEFRNRLRKYTT